VELISVALPNYNGGEYLRLAIESILKQTYRNFELIVVDDCSTDNSLEIIDSFNDKRIRTIILKSNGGIVNALNTAISEAKGEYIARMDSDDVSHPLRFEKCINKLNENIDIGVVGSWMETFGDENKIWKYHSSDEALKKELLFGSPMSHPASMFRSNILKKEEIKYESTFPHMEDYLFFYKLSKVTKFCNIPEVLYSYRLHQTNITGVNRSTFKERLIKIQTFILNDSLAYSPSKEFSENLFQISSGVIINENTKALLNWSIEFKVLMGNEINSLSIFHAKWEKMLFKLIEISPIKGFLLAIKSRRIDFSLFKYALKKFIEQ
jgi:glycosyltransferase involved in cell wall biosynthesis